MKAEMSILKRKYLVAVSATKKPIIKDWMNYDVKNPVHNFQD